MNYGGSFRKEKPVANGDALRLSRPTILWVDRFHRWGGLAGEPLRSGSLSSLGSERSKDLVLLVGGLEATVADLGGRVDEFDIDLLGLPRLDSGEDGLSEGHGSLLGADDTTLDENEVLVDLTVVGEATERGDVLDDGVGLSGGVVVDTSDGTGTDAVDLLVHLSSGVVTLLTATRHRPLDGGRMPGTDTSDLAATSVRLALETLDIESLDDTLGTETLGDTDHIDALALLEDAADAHLLLEVAVGPLHLVGDAATVDLDLTDVSLVLAEAELADLGSAKDADDRGVLGDASDIAGNVGLVLLVGLVLAVDVLGEALALGGSPVLVEAALHIRVEVLGPDGGEGAETTDGLDVADEADDLHGGALDNGGGVHDVLLDGLLTLTALLVLDDVGHASLVADEGGKVDGLGGVVAGERSNAAAVVARAALGHVGQRVVPGVLELTVRHAACLRCYLIMINTAVGAPALLAQTRST